MFSACAIFIDMLNKLLRIFKICQMGKANMCKGRGIIKVPDSTHSLPGALEISRVRFSIALQRFRTQKNLIISSGCNKLS